MTLPRLLGVGFGRTGTKSTKLALERLGWGPCHHMHEIRDHPGQLPAWQAAARGEPVDWDSMLSGYVSQIDWPGARYWRVLVDHFAEAKVLLTVRDPDQWYDSLRRTIVPTGSIGRVADIGSHGRAMAEMLYQTVHVQVFHGRIDDRDYAIGIYLDHIREVQQTVPPNRLLTFDVREGWEPLCAFLNEPVPASPFPRINTLSEFLENKDYLADFR